MSWLAASRSFAPSMLWRVASRSFCGTGAANTPPAAARAASSSTTSDSSGKRRSKRVSVSGSPSAMPPTTTVRGNQVIVAQLLHRTVAINAHREAAMRRPSRPARPARAPPALPRRPAAPQRAASLRAAARRRRPGQSRAAGSTGTCALAYSPRPDAGAKQFRALWVGGAVPALGDRRPADRPGDARQDRRQPADRARTAGDDGPAQVIRHHDTGSCAAAPRLAFDRPPSASASHAALAAKSPRG